MPVTDKMKSALRRTMGGQNTGDAPFNAASQGGYRNMAKQIAGGAKMSPRGMATAQQGVAAPARQAPLTANDTTQAAAGQALQRFGTGPAATDMMGQRGMGGGLGAVDTSMARGLSDVGGGLQGPGLAGRAATPAGTMTGKVGDFAGRLTSPAFGSSAEYGNISNEVAANAAARNAAARAAADAAERASDTYVPAPPQTAAGASGGVQDTGDMVEQTIRDLLMGGLRDTTAEENLVREMMQAQQQQALVDQRARAGRAGLVQTGAQAGIESDIRQRAAQAALRDIMGIQAEARGERRADIGLAGQLYGTDAALAAEEARTTALLQALQSMYGQGDSGGDNGGWVENPLPVGDENTMPSIGPQSDAEQRAAELGFNLRDAEEGNVFDRFAPDNKHLFAYTDENGNRISVYQRPDGSYFYQDESMVF